MILPVAVLPVVIVVLNGVPLPAVPPAQLVAGRVMAPVAPVVTRLVRRVAVESFGAIVLEARGHRCTFRVGWATAACDDRFEPLESAPYERDGTVFLPLGDVARVLGGTLSFDPASGTAQLRLAPEHELVTPPPSGAPPGGPSPALTPGPTPTPNRPEVGPSPRPRRTPLGALPS